MNSIGVNHPTIYLLDGHTTPGLDSGAFQVVLGSFGVILLLLAFFLNLFKIVHQDNKVYILLNILGAGISCYASFLIHYTPFIILEAVWCLVAVAALFKNPRQSR